MQIKFLLWIFWTKILLFSLFVFFLFNRRKYHPLYCSISPVISPPLYFSFCSFIFNLFIDPSAVFPSLFLSLPPGRLLYRLSGLNFAPEPVPLPGPEASFLHTEQNLTGPDHQHQGQQLRAQHLTWVTSHRWGQVKSGEDIKVKVKLLSAAGGVTAAGEEEKFSPGEFLSPQTQSQTQRKTLNLFLNKNLFKLKFLDHVNEWMSESRVQAETQNTSQAAQISTNTDGSAHH